MGRSGDGKRKISWGWPNTFTFKRAPGLTAEMCLNKVLLLLYYQEGNAMFIIDQRIFLYFVDICDWAI